METLSQEHADLFLQILDEVEAMQDLHGISQNRVLFFDKVCVST